MCIAPGQGQTTLCGQNPNVNRKALSLCLFVASFKTISLILCLILPICCKFKKKSLILCIIFHVLYTYIAPGAGADTFFFKHKPFVTLVICCKFLPLNDFLTVSPI